jgi:hypothetical protein
MRKILTASVILCILFSLTASAQNARGTNKIEPLPRDLEIQLALSALPPHLRDHATVYVLNPAKGFEVARMDFTRWLHGPAPIRSGELGP